MVAGAAALLAAERAGAVERRHRRSPGAQRPTPAGDPADTGNGRLNLLRAMADASTDAIQPAGAAPVGDGGPLVGPYVAANVASVGGHLPGQHRVVHDDRLQRPVRPTGICGTAVWQSNSNTRAVAVSIRRLSDDLYWNGSAFSSVAEVFVDGDMLRSRT